MEHCFDPLLSVSIAFGAYILNCNHLGSCWDDHFQRALRVDLSGLGQFEGQVRFAGEVRFTLNVFSTLFMCARYFNIIQASTVNIIHPLYCFRHYSWALSHFSTNPTFPNQFVVIMKPNHAIYSPQTISCLSKLVTKINLVTAWSQFIDWSLTGHKSSTWSQVPNRLPKCHIDPPSGVTVD